jgi:hypothetical protein
MIFYYGWMAQVAPLSTQLASAFARELPTLVVMDSPISNISAYLDRYISLSRDGKPTGIYLRQDKAQEITPSERLELASYRFEIN